MKVEIREAAVFTGDDGKEVVVWDKDLVDRIKTIGYEAVTPVEAPEPARDKGRRQGHKPSQASQITIKDPPRHNDYGTRECDACHEKFRPRSGRAKVCDACRKAGALRKRGGKAGEPSAALQEVRKAAVDAGLREKGDSHAEA